MFRYAFRRTFRNWKLFLAILTGLLITTTLFASANVGSNAILTSMLEKTMEQVPQDMIYLPSSDDLHGYPNSTTLPLYQETIESVQHVQGTEIIVRHQNRTSNDEIISYYVTGIQKNSTIYEGLTYISGATTLAANETYIVTGSSQISDFPIGSNYTLQIQIGEFPATPILINVTLKVVGHVELTDLALDKLSSGTGPAIYFSGMEIFFLRSFNYFITDLEETFLPIIDSLESHLDDQVSGLDMYIYIYLDHLAVIDPYDIAGSVQNANQVQQQLQNLIGGFAYINNILSSQLNAFSAQAEQQRLTFLMVSMPVFFVALYMGITLNDVSFSLRRREVGLLLSKGCTRTQITGIFMREAFFVGILSSSLGFILSLLIVPLFIGTGTYTPINLAIIGVDTIFLTFVVGVALALISTYLPARKALQIPTTEALREYTLAGEPKGYPKMFTWLCFGLGSYKLILWILGISAARLFTDVAFTNPILSMLLAIWLLIDAPLGLWAPLLFFYGLTMILVKGTRRFHDYSTRFIRRILGDLGGIAAHTIRRRPARTAAIIFISALLVGYSVQTVGVLASHEDQMIRSIYADIGADIRVTTITPGNATDLLSVIRGLEGVRNAATEFSFTITTAVGSSQVRAINVSEWLNVAYYETTWFSGYLGNSAQFALEALTNDNHSIILERKIAVPLELGLGSELSVSYQSNGTFQEYEVVGFFGPEPELVSSFFGTEWQAEDTRSYMSVELLEELGSVVSPTGTVLISLASPEANADVVEALEAMDDITKVESASDTIASISTDVFLNAEGNMMRMGVLFALLLASFGTVVIVYLTLRERRQSTALMSARGLTYGQTVLTLVAESLTMMAFAVIVGLLAGFIVLYGVVSGSVTTPQLVIPSFLPIGFLVPVLLQIGAFIGLLLVATVIPILIEAYRGRYDLSVLR